MLRAYCPQMTTPKKGKRPGNRVSPPHQECSCETVECPYFDFHSFVEIATRVNLGYLDGKQIIRTVSGDTKVTVTQKETELKLSSILIMTNND